MWCSGTSQVALPCEEDTDIPTTAVFAWTDSTIVGQSLKVLKPSLGIGSPTFYQRWRQVPGVQNPADCGSRGLFPLELKDYQLWWNGPQWLRLKPSHWPTQSTFSECVPCEEKTICNISVVSRPGLSFLYLDSQALPDSRESPLGCSALPRTCDLQQGLISSSHCLRGNYSRNLLAKAYSA